MEMIARITFEEICDLEPAIRRAYRLAKMIGRRRGQPFCANALWYDFFKPIVHHVVGYHRRPSEIGEIQDHLSLDELIHMDEAGELREPAFPEITIGTSQSLDSRLKTAMAYDLAYRTIYEALPDCNHDGMCW